MKGFVDCPQISGLKMEGSRLKMEGNYWDDAACGIKARAAGRLWALEEEGNEGGRGMTAAGHCGEMLLVASRLFRRMHWKVGAFCFPRSLEGFSSQLSPQLQGCWECAWSSLQCCASHFQNAGGQAACPWRPTHLPVVSPSLWASSTSLWP